MAQPFTKHSEAWHRKAQHRVPKHSTLELLDKKHLIFGQGLKFLKFGHGNRGENEQNRRNNQENPRKDKKTQRKIDKKFRDRDPYFLLNISF